MRERREPALVVAGTGLVAATYGLVRLAYGLYLPDVSASLDLGPAAGGYVASGASMAYCAGAVVAALLGRHPRWLVVGAVATAALGSLAMALAPGVALFVPAAVVSSAGAGLASPALVTVVSRSVPARRRDAAQAVVNSGTGPGLVAAGLLALALLPDWRLGFVVAAAATAASGTAVLLLDGGPRPTAGAGGRTRPPRSLRRDDVPSRRVAALAAPALAAVLLGTSSAVVWTYARTHVVEQGLGAGASTTVWIAIGVGGSATVVTARRLSGLPPTLAWRLTTSVVAATTVALGLGAGTLPVALVAATAFGWGFVAATSALIAWAAAVLPDRAGEGTAALFVALVLGQSAGAAVAGLLADRLDLAAAFVLLAGVAVLAAACGAGRTAARRTATAGRRVDMDA
ncbi:MFS transporter [Nocardioides scoriae]|uniref:MFS transporter n=1 Tax=Nocardioides scoriae TaxID=642780 RepID=UPI0012F88DE1|nr:MFS transporter [Nocardioides scoriae]